MPSGSRTIHCGNDLSTKIAGGYFRRIAIVCPREASSLIMRRPGAIGVFGTAFCKIVRTNKEGKAANPGHVFMRDGLANGVAELESADIRLNPRRLHNR